MANIIQNRGYFNRRRKSSSNRVKTRIAAWLGAAICLAPYSVWDRAAPIEAATAIEMEQSRYVPDGAWGGSGIRLQVGRTSTKIEYPCADGEMEGRLKLDSKGNFRAVGTHSTLRPGPVREGQSVPARPARYEGSLSGSRMSLKVTLPETKEVVGTFVLQKDASTRLHRCL